MFDEEPGDGKWSVGPSREGRGLRLWGGLVIGLVLVGVLICRGMLGPRMARAGWGQDLAASFGEAQSTGKPLLAIFTAAGSPACEEMRRNLVSDSAVAGKLRGQFTLVELDVGEAGGVHAALAARVGAGTLPAMVLFDRSGAAVGRLDGVASGARALEWAEGARDRAGMARIQTRKR